MKRGLKERKDIEYYLELSYSLLLHEIEDEGKKYWIAELPDLPGCKSHGSTAAEAIKNAQEAKKDWILDALEEGEEIPTPTDRDNFSGKTLVRMSRSLHRALSLLAESEKLSLNQLIVTMLAKEVGRLDVLNRVEKKLDGLLKNVNDIVERSESTQLTRTMFGDLTRYHELFRYHASYGTELDIDAAWKPMLANINANPAVAVVGTTPAFDPTSFTWQYGQQQVGAKYVCITHNEEKKTDSEIKV